MINLAFLIDSQSLVCVCMNLDGLKFKKSTGWMEVCNLGSFSLETDPFD